MAVGTVREQVAREVQRALSEAGLSVLAACAMMPSNPDPKLLYRWLKQDVTAPLDRLEEFSLAVGQPLTVQIGGEEAEEAAPPWAERLTREIKEEVRVEIQKTQDLIAATLAGQLGELLEPIRRQLPDGLAPTGDRQEE